MSDFPPLPQEARGKRPVFFDDPAIDTLLGMLLELAQAHWVARERLARLEHWAAHAVTSATVPFDDCYALPAEAAARLAAERDSFVARLFAPVTKG
ncbi:MAG: hypothetical protein ACK4MT_06580 [Thermaurantiacus tibetensis]|uniref:hypothetical protein n=1 Tax=Thermaurantiacus tibetensis TaxID=2759035 RepID=UPI00188E9E4B|nr:hypothetical protein [Thermaurantiacus tibetensis]